MEIIDCTFRDGGYQTEWHFDRDLVNRYLQTMQSSGITKIEFGFRSPESSNSYGAHAYTSNRYLDSLEIPESLSIGVMINAKEFIHNGRCDKNLLTKVFTNEERHIKFIRVATDPKELPQAIEIQQELLHMEYEVHINLMKASEIYENHADSLKFLESTLKNSDLEYLTLADTFGSLNPKSTKFLIDNLAGFSGSKLGVHMHDNMGLAFANTIGAIEAGVQSIDSTISGIGRGPGNLRTEFLGSILSENEVNFDRLLAFTNENFEHLKQIHNWGASSLYFLAAKNKIHPTYAQILNSGSQYGLEQIVNAIGKLSDINSTTFSAKTLNESLMPISYNALEIENSLQSGWCGEKDMILLGSGRNLEQIAKHIDSIFSTPISNLEFVSLNLQPIISTDLISTYIISDQLKFEIDDLPNKLTSNLITSFLITDKLNSKSFIPKDLFIKAEQEGLELNFYNYSLFYALSVLKFGGAKNIYLCGFDGFHEDRIRHNLNQAVIDYFRFNLNVDVYVSTPSKYDCPQKSLFSLAP
jgi:4-hydroxy 2-oxovalerate aldolase